MMDAQCEEKAGSYDVESETEFTGMLVCQQNHQHIDEPQHQPHKAIIAIKPFLHSILNLLILNLFQHLHLHALTLIETHEVNADNHKRNAE